MNQIPLFKVRVNTEQALTNLREVFDSGYIGEGKWCERFEAELARVLDVEPWQVVLVNSGTSAIQLALALCGVEPRTPGGEVILNPTTCTSDPHAVLNQSGKIVWADVDKRSGLLDPVDAASKFTKETRAILSTDWGGAPAVLNPSWSMRIPVIQDAAHGFLGMMYGRYVCYSFQAIKALTTGDGGALVVRASPKKAKEARLRRWFGLDRTSNVDFRCAQDIKVPGGKYHASDIDAAIGLANLPGAIESVARSRENARWYHQNLPKGMLVPWDEESPWWIYTILHEERERFMAYAKEKGIATSPVHARCDKHSIFPKSETPLPGVDYFCSRNVALPSGWWVGEEDRQRIADAVWRFA